MDLPAYDEFKAEMIQVVEEYFKAGGSPDADMPPMALLRPKDGKPTMIDLIEYFDRGEKEHVGDVLVPNAIRSLHAEYAALIMAVARRSPELEGVARDAVQVTLFRRCVPDADAGWAEVLRHQNSSPTLGRWSWLEPGQRLQGLFVDENLRAINDLPTLDDRGPAVTGLIPDLIRRVRRRRNRS
jgi:hypothetical protein